VRGFRLAGRRPFPPILVAALRPACCAWPAGKATGRSSNWLGSVDVPKVVAEVGPGKEIVARIFVFPSEDRDLVLQVGRRMVAAYLNVPVYAAFHEWLGRGPLLGEYVGGWKAGERKAALAAILSRLVDDLLLSGRPAR